MPKKTDTTGASARIRALGLETEADTERAAAFDAAAECSMGLAFLRKARDCFKAAGARNTLRRVRLAIASAGGAQRHARNAPSRAKRKGAA